MLVLFQIDDTDAVEDIHSLLTDAPTPPGTILIFSALLCTPLHSPSSFLLIYLFVSFQGFTAATQKLCLGFITGLLLYRYILVYIFLKKR